MRQKWAVRQKKGGQGRVISLMGAATRRHAHVARRAWAKRADRVPQADTSSRRLASWPGIASVNASTARCQSCRAPALRASAPCRGTARGRSFAGRRHRAVRRAVPCLRKQRVVHQPVGALPAAGHRPAAVVLQRQRVGAVAVRALRDAEVAALAPLRVWWVGWVRGCAWLNRAAATRLKAPTTPPPPLPCCKARTRHT